MGTNQLKKLTLLASLLVVLLVSPLHTAFAQSTEEEATCTLNAQTSPECSSSPPLENNIANDAMHEVIALTDENFDELTWTPTPSTWLIMFKTDACGICKKALPVFDMLSKDPAIIGHNEDQKKRESGTEVGGEGQPPNGPIYIATIDANWHGRDVTKRFEVDATPTIIVLRNEGFDSTKYALKRIEEDDNLSLFDMSSQKMKDTRTYYTYRGQRAQYPLRTFVLGGYTFRAQTPMPPPLSSLDSKPSTLLGQIYEYTKPYLSVILKLLAAWFTLLGCLGLFMRIHNYAWGDEEDYDKKEREIELEKAKGRKEVQENKDERTAERQKKMWEKKMENRAKFAAKKEERRRMAEVSGKDGEDDDDDFVGIGFSVKKADIQKDMGKAKGGAKSKNN